MGDAVSLLPCLCSADGTGLLLTTHIHIGARNGNPSRLPRRSSYQAPSFKLTLTCTYTGILHPFTARRVFAHDALAAPFRAGGRAPLARHAANERVLATGALRGLAPHKYVKEEIKAIV